MAIQPATLNGYQYMIELLHRAVVSDMYEKGLFESVVPAWKYEEASELFGNVVRLSASLLNNGDIHFKIGPLSEGTVNGVVYEDVDYAPTY